MVSMSLNKVVLIAVEEEDFKVLDLIKMICLVTEDLVETLEVLEVCSPSAPHFQTSRSNLFRQGRSKTFVAG